uniref:SAWADEE domain-containing protein n=1 Tax=Ascaris lumbricoides TaxID=6252 RepID=A0A0M3HHL6_ASCLU
MSLDVFLIFAFFKGADMVEIFTELAKSKKMAEVSSIGTEQSTSNALVDEYRRTFCGHKKRLKSSLIDHVFTLKLYDDLPCGDDSQVYQVIHFSETERKTIETRAQCFRMMQENDRQCKEHFALGEF